MLYNIVFVGAFAAICAAIILKLLDNLIVLVINRVHIQEDEDED